MDFMLNSIHSISIVAIAIMIGGLLIAYIKKWLATYALIITNFIIFILSILTMLMQNEYILINELGFRPSYLSLNQIPHLYTLFTSMFVHSGYLHILGNMLVFFFIGVSFERRVGWKKFLIIYLLTGICGSLTHAFLNIGSTIPLVGASGAIFGIMGAFAYSYPNDEVVMPIPLGFIMVFRKIKVIYAVIIFAALETIIVLIGSQDNTAHFAHLGGLVSGAIIAGLVIGRNKPILTNRGTDPSMAPVYYEGRSRTIDYSNLEQLATTSNLQHMLSQIREETVPQVRDIWLDHFLEKTKCPNCNIPLHFSNGKIWCDKCDYKTKYEQT